MTVSSNLSATKVLVVGNPSDYARKRLASIFDLVSLQTATVEGIEPGWADKVQAVAAFGGVGAAVMDALPSMRIVANFGVGYDGIDAKHAATRGIMVTNTPDVLTEEVADTTIGLLLNTIREFSKAETYLRAGRWISEGPYRLTGATLRGRSAGIFGMGRIGIAIARRLEAFGLPVSYHNRNRVADLAYDYHPTLVSLAKAVDTLICVVPGGAATAKAVNAEVLAALGPNGVFINIGRGTTVDDDALQTALKSGTILAAGLDVFTDEPRVPAGLLDLPNATLLPHVGSASIHTRNAMSDLVVNNLHSWFTSGAALTPVPETTAVKSTH